MKPGRPSTTAAWVAGWRGLASLAEGSIIDDRIAESLLPPPYRGILAAARKFPRFFSAFVHFVDRRSAGRSMHLPLRTRAIDDAITSAVRAGAEQLVLLGAGLDSRALRLDVLREVTVFEVDHPAMQAYKRARVAELPLRARALRFVESDFERDAHGAVAERLRAAGHDASKKSVFLSEGVTMYLSAQAVTGLVEGVAERAAIGSTFLATYFLTTDKTVDGAALRWLLAKVSEPITTTMTPREFEGILRAHALDVISDEGDPEWTRRYLAREQPWSLERLVTALKR